MKFSFLIQYFIRAACLKTVHCSYSYCFMPTSALTLLTSISAPQNRITKFSNLLSLDLLLHSYQRSAKYLENHFLRCEQARIYIFEMQFCVRVLLNMKYFWKIVSRGPYTETIYLWFEPIFAKEIRRIIEWLREIKTADRDCYTFLLIQNQKIFRLNIN